MVGGLYFYFLGQIFPQFAFDPLFDLSLALMAFFGGIGTITGPLLGRARARVAAAVPHPDVLEAPRTYLIAYGVLFLAVDPAAPAWGHPDDRAAARATAARGRAAGLRPCRRNRRRAVASRGSRNERRCSRSTVSRSPSAASARCRSVDLSVERGRDQRSDRPERLRQDDAVQRHHRLRAHPAGRGSLRRQRDHERVPGPRVRARDRPHVPADADLRAPDRAGEHARGDPAQARAGCAA